MRGLRLGMGLTAQQSVAAAPPTRDTTGLTGLLIADPDAALTLAGANISTFLDQSGNGRNFPHTAEGTVWTRSTSTLCGTKHTAVTGGNYTRYLSAVGVTLGVFCTASAGTIVSVCKCDSVAASRSLISINTTDEMELRCISSSGTKFEFRVNDGSNKTALVAADTTNWHVVVARWDGAKIYVSVDGGTETETVCGNVTSTTGRVALCGNNGTAEFWRSGIAEIGFYNVCKTPSQIASIVSFLNSTYGTFPVA